MGIKIKPGYIVFSIVYFNKKNLNIKLIFIRLKEKALCFWYMTIKVQLRKNKKNIIRTFSAVMYKNKYVLTGILNTFLVMKCF